MEGPLARVPMPTHTLPVHSGWKIWCLLCVELKEYVDNLMGEKTEWTAVEKTGAADETS